MMRHLDHSQIRILTLVHEFKTRCAADGLQIDQGQAYECLLAPDPERQALARRFHNENIRREHSCGEIHFSDDQDDFFDMAAPEPEDTKNGGAEEKLREIMAMCPARHREKITKVLMEMKKPHASGTIFDAAPAAGISRGHFYRILGQARQWVSRPTTPEGWSGFDCSSLVQLDLDLGVVQ